MDLETETYHQKYVRYRNMYVELISIKRKMIQEAEQTGGNTKDE